MRPTGKITLCLSYILSPFINIHGKVNQGIKKLTMIILFACIATAAISQTYPIEVNINMAPPYPVTIDDFVDRLDGGAVLINNVTSSDRTVYIIATLSHEEGIFSITTEGKQSGSLTLTPGLNMLTTEHIGTVFGGITESDFITTGLSQEQRNNILLHRQLPDGQYKLCIYVRDEQNQPLSDPTDMSCAFFNVEYLDRPVIQTPFDGEELPSNEIMNISWTHDNWFPNQLDYQVKIIDLTELEFSAEQANDAMLDPGVSPAFETSQGNMMSITIVDKFEFDLVPGHTYAVRVTAFDPFNKIAIKNGGHSEVITFTYGVEGDDDLAVAPVIDYPQNGDLLSPNTAVINIIWSHELLDTVNFEYRIIAIDKATITPFNKVVKPSELHNNNNLYTLAYDKTIDSKTFSTLTKKVTTSIFRNDLVWQNEHNYMIAIKVIPKDGRIMFKDHGYSNFVTFRIGDMKADTLSYCDSTFKADIPDNKIPISIRSGKTYKMGKLDLFIDQLVDASLIKGVSHMYSGQGYITVDFANEIKIAVKFEDLRVNTDSVVFAGTLESIPDTLSDKLAGVAGSVMSDQLKMDHIAATALIAGLKMGGKLVSSLASNTPVSLPIGLDQTTITGDKILIAVTEIYATPQLATLTALMQIENPEWGEYIPVLGATDICFNKKGLSNNATLFLAEDYNIPMTGGDIKLKASEETASGETAGTYIVLSTKGFKEFTISAEFRLPRTFLIPENPDGTPSQDPNDKVTISLRGSGTSHKDFFLTASVAPCQIPGLEGFSFQMDNGTWDQSIWDNPDNFVFPKSYQYTVTNVNHWKGIFFKNITVRLPSDWGDDTKGSTPKASNRPTFQLTNLLIDNVGISFWGIGANLLSSDMGSMYGFAFSIDTVQLTINRNQFESASISGRLGLPILPENSFLKYKGIISQPDASKADSIRNDTTSSHPLAVSFSIKPDPKGYEINWLNAKITFTGSSIIEIKKNATEQGLYSNLSGWLTVMTNSDQNPTASAGQPKISLPGIKFENMEISRLTKVNQTSGSNNSTSDKGKFQFKPPVFSLTGGYSQSGAITGNAATYNESVGNSNVNAGTTTLAHKPQPKMNGFNFTINKIGLSDKKENISDAEEMEVSSGTNLALYVEPSIQLVAGQNTTGSTAADEKGVAITASAGFAIVANLSEGDNRLTFKEITLEKISIDAKIKGVGIAGELHIYNDDPVFGDGVQGGVKVKTDFIEVGINGRFGNVSNGNIAEDYTYFYLFGEVGRVGTSGNPPDAPFFSIGQYLAFWGFHGGVYYHMKYKEDIVSSNPYDKYIPDNSILLGFKAGATLSVTLRPEVMWAKITLGMTFTEQGINDVTLDGDAYILKKTMTPRAAGSNEVDGIEANLRLRLNCQDPNNIVFNGTLDVYANIQKGLLKGNESPDDLYKVVTSTMSITKDDWHFYMGEPARPGKVGLYVPSINLSYEATFYLMMGNQTMPVAELNPFIQGLLNKFNQGFSAKLAVGDESMRNDGGFVMGATIGTKLDLQSAIFYANLQTMLGFDLNLLHTTAISCINSKGGELGVDGWYAQGQVFAGLDGDVGLDIDLGFYKGKLSLLALQAVLLIQGGLPNPFYADGTANVAYSLFNGFISGKISLQVSVGEQCIQKQVDPNSGVEIIAGTSPTDGGEDVSVYATPRIHFNCEIGKSKTYTVQVKQGLGYVPKTIRMFVAQCFMREDKKGANFITTEFKMENSKTGLLKPAGKLKPNTRYVVLLRLESEFKEKSFWIPYSSRLEYTFRFKTGPEPNNLAWENVEMIFPDVHGTKYLQSENPAGKGIIQLIVPNPNLLQVEKGASKPWHSSMVVKFYNTGSGGKSLITSHKNIHLYQSGKTLVFDMPASLPVSSSILCEIVRAFTRNQSAGQMGGTQPQDELVFSYTFQTSQHKTLKQKVNASHSKSIVFSGSNTTGNKASRAMDYKMSGGERFSENETKPGNDLASDKVTTGRVLVAENYYSGFYDDYFDFFEYERKIFYWSSKLIGQKHPVHNSIVRQMNNNNFGHLRASIDDWTPKNSSDRKAGFRFYHDLVSLGNGGSSQLSRSRVITQTQKDLIIVNGLSQALLIFYPPNSPEAKEIHKNQPLIQMLYSFSNKPPSNTHFQPLRFSYAVPQYSGNKVKMVESSYYEVKF